MSFDIAIRVDAQGALPAIAKVEGALDKVEKKSKEGSLAADKLAKSFGSLKEQMIDSVVGFIGPAAIAATSLGAISAEIERWGQHEVMIKNAANAMLRFRDNIADARAAVDEQVKASQLLGVTVNDQIEAFDAVSDAAEGMALTHGQLMDITRNLSMVMIHEGKSMADVGQVMEQLQFGMAKGSLEMRELKSIIKGLPEVADMMAKSLGVTRGELLAMAESGKLGTRQIIAMMQGFENGAEISKKFAERQLDIKEVMEQQHVSMYEAILIVGEHKQAVMD